MPSVPYPQIYTDLRRLSLDDGPKNPPMEHGVLNTHSTAPHGMNMYGMRHDVSDEAGEGGNPPQTPQMQQTMRWTSPQIGGTVPAFDYSPTSPSSPEMSLSPQTPVNDESMFTSPFPRMHDMSRASISPLMAHEKLAQPSRIDLPNSGAPAPYNSHAPVQQPASAPKPTTTTTATTAQMQTATQGHAPAPTPAVSRQTSMRRSASIRRTPSVREKVGDLTLGKAIGSGSFSQTYMAHSSAGRVYAVKKRLPTTSPVLFQHEQSVLAKLSATPGADEANVVCFYPALSAADHSVFQMYESSLDELVRSPRFAVDPNSLDFFDFRIMSQPVVGLERWADWARQLAAGLRFIHAQHVVHADIKPDNVLVSAATNRLVIADFSGAIDLDVQPASVLAQDLIEGFAWSPVYTDPLVRNQSTLPSYGSDIYALGLVLAFMATGMEPYAGAKNATQRMLWMAKIKPLDSFDADIAPKLSRVRGVIDKCLERSFDGFDAAVDALLASN